MALVEAAAALGAVLVLIWLSAKAVRLTKIVRADPARNKSVAILEILALDSQRRLVLASCENKRVLLMIGGRQDLLVGWLDGKERCP
jgi:flagellar biogenesis protein FliO